MKGLAGLLIAVAVPVLAHPGAVPPAETATAIPAAQIAELMTPRDVLLSSTARGFDEQFQRAISADPRSAAMERAHPGVGAEAAAAARKVVLDAMIAGLPALRAATTGVVADELDGVEQAQLLAFLRTATGRRMVALGPQLISQEKLAQQGVGRPGTKLTEQQVAGATDLSALDQLTAREKEDIEQFGATPAGQKLVEITPKLQAATIAWVNELITAQQPAVQQAVVGAIRAHLAAEQKLAK